MALEDPGIEFGRAALKGGGVGRLGPVGQALGLMAPTGGLSFVPAVAAIFVGAAGPLAFLLGTVVGTIVALVFAAFASRLASAGSLYLFNGRSLGVAYGFISAWVMMLAYVLLAAAICPYESDYLAGVWAPLGNIPPTLVGVIILAIAAFLSWRGVRLSTYLVAIVEFVGVGAVLIVGLVVIAHGGAGGHRLGFQYFTPNGLSFSGLAFGVAFTFSGLSGFESAANLGEESRRPRVFIPSAIVVVMLGTGLLYIFGSWTETMGFASATALSKAGVPLITVADHFLAPWFGHVIAAVAGLSLFGAIVAELNAASRLLFTLGRDGFAHARLADVHRTYRTPTIALGVVVAGAALAFIPLYSATPPSVFAYIGTEGGVAILVAYFLTMVAGSVYFIKHRSRTRLGRLFPILPIIAVPMTGYTLYSTVIPVPAFPVNVALYTLIAWIVVGVGLIAWLPGLRQRLGRSPLFHELGEEHVGNEA
jgi:amino acid transporter